MTHGIKFLTREKHFPEECEQARKDTLATILDKWHV